MRNCCVSLQIKLLNYYLLHFFFVKKGNLNERNREGRGKSFGCLLQSNNKYIWFDLFFLRVIVSVRVCFTTFKSLFFLWWYKRHRRENAWKKLGWLEIHYLSLILFFLIFSTLSFYTTNKSLCSINFLSVAGLANVWQIFIVIKNKYYTLLKLLSLANCVSVWGCVWKALTSGSGSEGVWLAVKRRETNCFVSHMFFCFS